MIPLSLPDVACRITYIDDYTLQVRGDYAPNVDISNAKFKKLGGWHLEARGILYWFRIKENLQSHKK